MIQKYNIENTIIEVEKIKNKIICNCDRVMELMDNNKKLAEKIDTYNPLCLKHDQYKRGDDYKKYINRKCWYYIVSLFDMKKYMLCSEYNKMNNNIENNNIPDFNKDNVLGWVRGLKDLIYDNLNTLVKSVFKRITEEHYYTGNGWYRGNKKKRNNNGVDKFFILTTYDYSDVFNYKSSVTVTDDLEKCFFILSGNKVPDEPIKRIMRKNKIDEWENNFFRIKIYKNGNTHYWIKDQKLLNKLNLIGSGEGIIGENIRIKILERV
jgi:hypothetical protein